MINPTSPRSQYLLATAEHLAATAIGPVDGYMVRREFATARNLTLQETVGYTPSVLRSGQQQKLVYAIVDHARYLQVSK